MYELDLQLVKEYLDTLPEEKAAGRVASAPFCPVSQALKARYGKAFMVDERSYNPIANHDEELPTPTKVSQFIRLVDREPRGTISVQRAKELLERVQQS